MLLGNTKKRNEFFFFPCFHQAPTEPLAELLLNYANFGGGCIASWIKKVRMLCHRT